MSNLLKMILFFCWCCVAVGIGWTIGYFQDLRYQVVNSEYQLGLAESLIAHNYEVIDDMQIQYEVAKDCTDFWASECEAAQNRNADLRDTLARTNHELDATRASLTDACDRLSLEINREPAVITGPPVTVEATHTLEDWENESELTLFLKEHDAEVPVMGLAGEDGIVQFDGQCVGYTISWRDYAAGLGKNLEIIVLTPQEYQKWFGKEITDSHAILMAIVEKYKLYYIEPQTLEVIQTGFAP